MEHVVRKIDAVILAGGQGLRMGGRDKGLVELAGRPLVAWAIDALLRQQPQPEQILISANRHLAEYARFGYPVLHDVHDGYPGPLAGIHAALLASPAELLLVVACDVPFLPDDLLQRLLDGIGDAPVAVAQSENGRLHPTTCLLRRGVLLSLTERLNCKELQVADWIATLKPAYVEFPDTAFANVNTPEELAACQQRIGSTARLTHFDAAGQAHMVDVGAKPETARIAVASGQIRMQPATLALLAGNGHKKGDVLGIARIAAIMAAKKTADLIPLCHPIPLTRVAVDFALDQAGSSVHCTVSAETMGRTGVEMEALTAVNVALLTIYDMCKAVDRGMTISEVRLLEKHGGKSGSWQAA